MNNPCSGTLTRKKPLCLERRAAAAAFLDEHSHRATEAGDEYSPAGSGPRHLHLAHLAPVREAELVYLEANILL